MDGYHELGKEREERETSRPMDRWTDSSLQSEKKKKQLLTDKNTEKPKRKENREVQSQINRNEARQKHRKTKTDIPIDRQTD